MFKELQCDISSITEHIIHMVQNNGHTDTSSSDWSSDFHHWLGRGVLLFLE